MESMLMDKLRKAGVDVNGTLERFMNNEPIYEKFLKKFLADTNYSQLEKTIGERDYTEALKYAHTLKGVSGNLGLTEIFSITEKMVAMIRNNDLDGIDAKFESLKAEYNRICSIIESET